MKKNIAYKQTQSEINYPNGFVKEFFETDDDLVEGYNVILREDFPKLMENNKKLMTSFVPDMSNKIKEVSNTQQPSNDDALFQQFLAWKNSQGS